MVCREKIKLKHINKELQMLAEVIITNVHKRNFAFGHAVDPINEQVFIPSHVVEGIDLKPSDIVEATLVPNYADKSSSGTKYMAVKISLLNTSELNKIDSVKAPINQHESGQNMKYDWEEDVDYDIIQEVIDCELPEGIILVGLALANIDNVEGCLIADNQWVGGDIAQMDIWKDIDGDAGSYYQKCLDSSRAYYEKRQADKKKGTQ